MLFSSERESDPRIPYPAKVLLLRCLKYQYLLTCYYFVNSFKKNYEILKAVAKSGVNNPYTLTGMNKFYFMQQIELELNVSKC